MATKFKGIYKSFKHITQIFVVKEREMEIGYPTDVKHVAHIGLDGLSGSEPSWMNDFETANFSTSLGNLGGVRDPNPKDMYTSWSSQDFEESRGKKPTPNTYNCIPSSGASHVPKKPKRKKVKSTSFSETFSVISRLQSSRTMKSKDRYSESETTPIAQA
ncbi:hypothetical protein TanjilG_19557 [Lupinus angustifolius]|uniref:CRIB domain-containing protein n=1 Tax=Lupinus angustifolius TaxID=3871 RepID=A0A1J7H2U7_LUPAN|nr:PREDICTED: CRIB domain-containing protein RIC10-like [Lupinus angustifolius]XP_019451989.1 PREDICTED: CRIB domain-containing protein RIC10-like [Lupinus angustifolius]OIW06908.1 hypothetical protein TanjilG_19557 [Lupinus angustifolius]